MVGKLAIDQPGAQRGLSDLENRLVAGQPDAQRILAGGLDQARELSQRSRWDVGLEPLPDRGFELGALHGEPVGVSGDHRHLVALDRHEYAGEHRAGLVARCRTGDPVDGVAQRRRWQLRRVSFRLREAREVIGGQSGGGTRGAGVSPMSRSASATPATLAVRQGAHDLHQQPARHTIEPPPSISPPRPTRDRAPCRSRAVGPPRWR